MARLAGCSVGEMPPVQDTGRQELYLQRATGGENAGECASGEMSERFERTTGERPAAMGWADRNDSRLGTLQGG
jgi:hypothetical protein